MMSSIWSGDEWLIATGGGGSLPYIPNNTQNPIQGMLRVMNNSIEVFNGSGWQSISTGSASISLSSKASTIMKWAEEKMKAERDIMKAIETSPAVADAYKSFKEAEEKLLVVMTLSQEDSNERNN
jgi:hypothetical protein